MHDTFNNFDLTQSYDLLKAIPICDYITTLSGQPVLTAQQQQRQQQQQSNSRHVD